MPDSSSSTFVWREAGHDQLCHDLKNPLMVIRGRSQLVERAILRSAELPDAERTRILHSLAAIEAAVLGIVKMVDDTRPAHLMGSTRGKSSLVRPRSS